MKRIGIVALVLCLGAVGRVGASECTAGCIDQRRACLQAASLARFVCVRECTGFGREQTDCRRACSDTNRVARSECSVGRVECRTLCPTNGSPCQLACGRQLDGCAIGVLRAGPRCRKRCARAPGDGLACASLCADVTQSGAANCLANLAACAVTCGGS